jgi:hypothetical protein
MHNFDWLRSDATLLGLVQHEDPPFFRFDFECARFQVLGFIVLFDGHGQKRRIGKT